MTSTPRKLRTTEPRPPIRLVPPMTTAAIADSSRPMPRWGRPKRGDVEDAGQAGQSARQDEDRRHDGPRIEPESRTASRVGADRDE